MPTALQREVVRELEREGYIVRFAPEGIYAKQKRKRFWYGPLSWSKVFWDCVNVQVQETRKAKEEQKLERKLRRIAR